MSQNTILALQSFLIFLQIVNAGIASVVKEPLVSLVLSAGVGSFQYFVNHVGNQSISPEVKAVLTDTQLAKIDESKRTDVK